MLVRAIAAASVSFALFLSSASLAQSSVSQADINQAKAEIEQLKQDLQLKEAQLRVLELQMARKASAPTPVPAPTKAVAVSPAAKAPAAIAPQAPHTLLRSSVDSSPYEASVVGRVPAFRMTPSDNWVVLDEKRMVYWVLDDEAYLLNLSDNCPELLNAARLRLENFSTKVRAGQDGVLVGNQRCLIASIEKLGGHRLPKPPRR